MGKDRLVEKTFGAIEAEAGTHVEYGVPKPDKLYKKIWQRRDRSLYSESLSLKAADLVETENKNGKAGAFVVRRMLPDYDEMVEVWSEA